VRLTGFLTMICGLALVLALQDALLAAVHLPLAAPDLLLVVVAAVGFARGPRSALIAGFLLGLAADISPPAAHAIGSQAFVLCLSGYLAGRAAGAVHGTVLRPILVVACLAAFSPYLYAALDYAVGSGEFHGEARGLPSQRSHSRLPGVKTLNRRASAGSTQVL
jgi:rod shape-determining protein MreD